MLRIGRAPPNAMRRIVKDFLKGLLVVVPVVTTIYLVWLPVTFFDDLILVRILGLEFEGGSAPFPGVGLAITAVGIWVVGVLASNRLGARIVKLVEKLIRRVPALDLLYSTVSDLVGAFVGEKRKFDRPVVVDLFPGKDVRALGFITRDALDMPGLEDRIAVYFPQSYNIAGNLLVLPRERVTPLEVDAGKFMSLIVSGGVTGGSETDEGSA